MDKSGKTAFLENHVALVSCIAVVVVLLCLSACERRPRVVRFRVEVQFRKWVADDDVDESEGHAQHDSKHLVLRHWSVALWHQLGMPLSPFRQAAYARGANLANIPLLCVCVLPIGLFSMKHEGTYTCENILFPPKLFF